MSLQCTTISYDTCVERNGGGEYSRYKSIIKERRLVRGKSI